MYLLDKNKYKYKINKIYVNHSRHSNFPRDLKINTGDGKQYHLYGHTYPVSSFNDGLGPFIVEDNYAIPYNEIDDKYKAAVIFRNWVVFPIFMNTLIPNSSGIANIAFEHSSDSLKEDFLYIKKYLQTEE